MHSPGFGHAVKGFLLAYHAGVSIAALPGKERRNDLEEISWQAVLEAVFFRSGLSVDECDCSVFVVRREFTYLGSNPGGGTILTHKLDHLIS
jgi:hypothetical protein